MVRYIQSYISSTNRVVYIGIVEAHTIPLLVIDNTNCNFSISGNSSLCSGTSNYTLTGVPIGANVSWVSSNTSVATVTTNTNPTIVTKVGNGNITLTATYLCGSSNVMVSKPNVVVGSPVITNLTSSMTGSCNGTYQEWFLNASSISAVTNWLWTVDNPNSGSWVIYSPNQPNTLVAVSGGGGISVTATNTCGTSKSGVTIWSNCYGLIATPNPTTDDVTISITQPTNVASANKKKAMIYQIKVTDQPGNIKKLFKYSSGISNPTISLSGLIKGAYIIQAFDGTSWSSVKIIKQ